MGADRVRITRILRRRIGDCKILSCYFRYCFYRGDSMERINQRTNHLVGENIKRLRIEKGLRNKDIVTKLQVEGVEISTGTYSKVEMGLNNPSVDLLIALTKIFSCDFNTFSRDMINELNSLSKYLIILIKIGGATDERSKKRRCL